MTKPVIASNHGGSREIIENNVSGWLVPPSDPEALAEKITFVLELPQRKKDLVGNNARKRVIEKFSLIYLQWRRDGIFLNYILKNIKLMMI